MIFELPQRNTKCLFVLIRKTATIICYLSLQSNFKDNILYYKTVKVTINALNFAEVILNIVAYLYGLLGPVLTNNSALNTLKPCYCYIIFQTLDVAILLRFICKPAALLKDQIAASGVYL